MNILTEEEKWEERERRVREYEEKNRARWKEEEEKQIREEEELERKENLLLKPVDLELFFKPLNERGDFNYGLINCINNYEENTVEFLKRYTNEAYLNGIIEKDYLDTIHRDNELIKTMMDMMNETEEYTNGSFFHTLFDKIDSETIKGIRKYGSSQNMILDFAEEYRKKERPKDFNVYMDEAWFIMGQLFKKYYKILELIPNARKTQYPLKFLYYGRPNLCAFYFFYILVKNYCDVVIVTPKDYDYKEVAKYRIIRRWIKFNISIEKYER